MFSIQDIYNIAIQLERNGEKEYLQAAGTATDTELITCYKWLAKQEAKHAEWFSAQLKLHPQQISADEKISEFSRDILQKIVADSSFLSEGRELTTIRNREEALQNAINMAKDTILLYEVLLELIEDEETRKEMGKIIAEEQSHIKLLETL